MEELVSLLYDVHLESQTDSQRRQMTVAVPGSVPATAREMYARAIAVRSEQEYVDFSLLPKTPIEPEQPNVNDANVLLGWLAAKEAYAQDVDAHQSRVTQAQGHYDALTVDHGIDAAGKAFGPTKIGRAHLHLHRQALPYVITDIKPNVPRVKELVRAALALSHHEGQWEQALREMREAGLPINAVTASLAGLGSQKQLDGSTGRYVWSSDTIKTSLHTAYTFNNDTHANFSDASSTEITGTGYTAGGVTLASKTSTYDTATDQIRLDAADVSWTTSTLSATDAVVYFSTGTSSTSTLIGNVDFGSTVTTTAGTFLITWDVTGIVVYDVT